MNGKTKTLAKTNCQDCKICVFMGVYSPPWLDHLSLQITFFCKKLGLFSPESIRTASSSIIKVPKKINF